MDHSNSIYVVCTRFMSTDSSMFYYEIAAAKMRLASSRMAALFITRYHYTFWIVIRTIHTKIIFNNKLMHKKKFSLFAGLLVAIKTSCLSLS